MSNGKSSAAEVVAEAKAAHDELAALERKLEKEINAIDFKVAKEKRKRTDAELKERGELNASLDKVQEAFIVLAYDAAMKLDSTAEVESLHQKMAQVNGMLAEDIGKLKKIEKVAAVAAQVADALAKGAEKLAKIAAEGLKPG